jgi:hypothetical protein
MTPISKSQASSGLLNAIERNKGKLQNCFDLDSYITINILGPSIHPPSQTRHNSESDIEDPLPKSKRTRKHSNRIQDKGKGRQEDAHMNDSDAFDTSLTSNTNSDTNMSDAEQLDHRPNILSLYNPNDDATDTQQAQSSSRFGMNVDRVLKPSWTKDINSQREQSLAHCSCLLTVHLANFKVFLNALTEDTIDRAITCFEEGIHSSKVLIGHFDSRRAQLTCNSILQMTRKGSTAMALVNEIPKFWVNLTGLIHSSNMNSIESTMTCVFCMQGVLKFHYWLLDIIPAAIERTSKPSHKAKTWIDRLATDVRSSLQKGTSATFHSSKYLPQLTFPSEYKMAPQSFQYNNNAQLTSIISSTLRSWLRFPGDQEYLAQLVLLEIITANSLPSILFLDKIWEMYLTPFSTVFKNDWHTRRSKNKLTKALENFEKAFASHPFNISNSLSHRKLQYLHGLIHEWMKLNDISAEIVS